MLDPINDDPAEVLKELGRRMQVIDLHLVGLMAQRLSIAHRVGYAKRRQASTDKPLGADIYREDIELSRLEEVRAEAIRLGMSPEFAAGMLYAMIGESCKRQMIQREQKDFSYGNVDYAQLKENLVLLAEAAASNFDDSYTSGHPATQAYMDFETRVIRGQIEDTEHQSAALDLGCCTGRTTFLLAEHFDRVVGVDISRPMILRTGEKAKAAGITNLELNAVDMEDRLFWLDHADSSFDFVTMTLGTASDVRDISGVLAQIERVLKPHGRFVLSFYNSDALHLQAGFFPWPSSLAAVVDPSRHCLDVWVGGKSYSVYAKAESIDGIDRLMRRRLSSTNIYTHPTMAALLPREVMIDEHARKVIEVADRQRAESGADDGAYILVTGRKS